MSLIDQLGYQVTLAMISIRPIGDAARKRQFNIAIAQETEICLELTPGWLYS